MLIGITQEMHNKLHELSLHSVTDPWSLWEQQCTIWSIAQHSTAPAPPTCCCSSPVSAATNGRSSLASSIHRQSHMRKEATARRDVASSSIQRIRALSFFCSLLSQAAAVPACVCVSEWVCALVCTLPLCTRIRACTHTHSHTRAAIALYLLVLMALLCVCVCLAVCACGTVSVCGWLANNKNEECRQEYGSAFNSKGAQENFLR